MQTRHCPKNVIFPIGPYETGLKFSKQTAAALPDKVLTRSSRPRSPADCVSWAGGPGPAASARRRSSPSCFSRFSSRRKNQSTRKKKKKKSRGKERTKGWRRGGEGRRWLQDEKCLGAAPRWDWRGSARNIGATLSLWLASLPTLVYIVHTYLLTHSYVRERRLIDPFSIALVGLPLALCPPLRAREGGYKAMGLATGFFLFSLLEGGGVLGFWRMTACFFIGVGDQTKSRVDW